VVSQPPFKNTTIWTLEGDWWTLRRLSQATKKGRKLLVSLPFLFAFMDYILHMSFHIRKQGSTLNMPIAAIKVTNLFGGHLERHLFRPKCFYL
jgi:hypothetical protein